MATDEQLSMFSPVESMGLQQLSLPTDAVPIGRAALIEWKQRIFAYQARVRSQRSPQQGSLFDLALPTVASSLEPDSLDPFSLPPQNTEFWRWKAYDSGCAALYFVIDHELPVLLYVGETVKSNQRWKGEHDCKRYLQQYVSAHRPHQLPVAVNIGFWPKAPQGTRPRQQLESALIYKWRSPFNKENWSFWGTPFVGGKLP